MLVATARFLRFPPSSTRRIREAKSFRLVSNQLFSARRNLIKAQFTVGSQM